MNLIFDLTVSNASKIGSAAPPGVTEDVFDPEFVEGLDQRLRAVHGFRFCLRSAAFLCAHDENWEMRRKVLY